MAIFLLNAILLLFGSIRADWAAYRSYVVGYLESAAGQVKS
jgi:hypothetical protein